MSRSVASIIERDRIVAVPASVSVRQAVAVMAENRCGSVLVMDGSTLLGIFTERDLTCRVVASGRDLDATKVDAAMTHDPDTIEADSPVADAIRRMDECSYRYLPVMRDGACIGVISAKHLPFGDVLAMADELRVRHDLAERML